MADGILGLLGAGVDKVQGLLSNPTVQGLGAAAAFGFNPLLGLLAAPGIKNSRERKAMENDLLRDEILARKRRADAQEKLTGLLSGDTAVSAPVGLMRVGGGMDVLPAGRRVPTISTPQGQEKILGLLSQANPQAFNSAITSGLLGQMFPQASGLQQKIDTVSTNLGRQLTDAEVLKMAGGGTTINVGGESKLDEPVPLTQLPNLKDPNGRTAPVGITFRQARDGGYRVVSESDQTRQQQADTALGILNELETLSGELFSQVEPGFVNRAAAALNFAVDSLTQNDPAASQFRDLSESTIAPFVRFLGESGALAEGDVTRALGLLPNIFPLPDTGEVAKEKLETLRGIIERGVRKLNSPQQTVDLGNGATLEFVD